jgi:hypothetical protein
MLSDQRGDAAAPDVERWAKQIAGKLDDAVKVNVSYESDSNTFIVRLAKNARVLLFRFSEGQVHEANREAECEKTLQRKIKDLWNLI